jgi:DNA invertase Pin-like site-specific DNA recombinase
MHSCDVRRCVNPAHLSVGTCSENHWDRSRKGRNPGNATIGSARRGGRQRTLDVERLKALRAAGLTYEQIGKALGVSNATVWRNLNT